MKPSFTRFARLPLLSRLPRPPVFFLLSLGLASLAFAASSTVPIEYLRPMKNNISIGVRMLGGADVTFGGPGLGRISAINMNDIYDAENGTKWRDQYIQNNGGIVPYDDGTVYYNDAADATASSPGRPSQSGIPAGANGRWQTVITLTSTTGNTAQVTSGDYLAYDTSGNTTRNWSATNASQVVHGTDADGNPCDYINMSTYASNGVVSGQTAHASSSAHPGIELQFGRVIQRFKRFEWGFNFTFGISEFNAKNRQTLDAEAIKYTDQYQVVNYAENPTAGGAFVTVPGTLNLDALGNPIISGPSFTDLPYTDADGNTTMTDADGNPIPLVFANGYETTSPLGVREGYAPQPLDSSNVTGGQVSGYWQVKGVYYLFRLGPMIRMPIGKHFSASVSAGYIAAWVGSKMRFQESLNIPGITFSAPKYFTIYNVDYSTGTPTLVPVTDISKNNQKYLSGGYVDVNLEWWISTRTGFYVGAVCEKLANYTQKAYERVATVKMDSGIGLHFGIMTRF
jgi:hypothetical protein